MADRLRGPYSKLRYSTADERWPGVAHRNDVGQFIEPEDSLFDFFTFWAQSAARTREGEGDLESERSHDLDACSLGCSGCLPPFLFWATTTTMTLLEMRHAAPNLRMWVLVVFTSMIHDMIIRSQKSSLALPVCACVGGAEWLSMIWRQKQNCLFLSTVHS